jgi:hypothetical protein
MINKKPPCLNCKFRLYTNKNKHFHCAANINGWAFIHDEKRIITMPPKCDMFLSGNGTFIGKELMVNEFFKTRVKLFNCLNL